MKTNLDLRATGLNEQKSELLSRVADMNGMFRGKSCIIVQMKTGLSFDDRQEIVIGIQMKDEMNYRKYQIRLYY